MKFLDRVLGIIKIDGQVFKEIERNNSSATQGVIIALLAGCINGLMARSFFGDFPILIMIFVWVLLNFYNECFGTPNFFRRKI